MTEPALPVRPTPGRIVLTNIYRCALDPADGDPAIVVRVHEQVMSVQVFTLTGMQPASLMLDGDGWCWPPRA